MCVFVCVLRLDVMSLFHLFEVYAVIVHDQSSVALALHKFFHLREICNKRQN